MTRILANLKILAIIPARGGSKGVPRKNIRLLGEHPLIAYTIRAAQASQFIDRIVVSTEDAEISQVSRSYGAEVIPRPVALADDRAATEPALIHTIQALEATGYRPDFIMLLQCTAPFRLAQDIEQAVRLLRDERFDAVISLTEINSHDHPQWIKEVRDGQVFSYYQDPDVKHPIVETQKYWQRQLLEGTYYYKNGSIYIFSYTSLMIHGHRFGTCCAPLLIPRSRSVNVDTLEDWEYAEYLLAQEKITLDYWL